MHALLPLLTTNAVSRLDMNLETDNQERAEAYRVLAQFFLAPPDEEALAAIRQDFSLDAQEPIDVITEEFNKLFLYPQGRIVPLESLFTRAGGTGYTDVASVYAGSDLAIDDSYAVAPDHISVELLFMSYLIENGKTEMEKKFLVQHLMNWVPYYCEEVTRQATTFFYREIADMVKDFLISEYDAYIR